MGKITNLKQNNSAWGAYPYAGENIAAAGCGPTAVADLLGLNSPVEVARWMTANGYASNGSGTYHNGITAALKHWGYDAKQITGSSLAGVMSSGLFDKFKQSIQAGNCGIILFGGVRTGCINNYWTNGGHYVAICGYKNGKYLVHDPASYTRDGWHTWDDFAGDIKHLFTSSVRWAGKTKEELIYFGQVQSIKFTGHKILTDGSAGPETAMQKVRVLQTALNKDYNARLKIDGDLGPLTKAALGSHYVAKGETQYLVTAVEILYYLKGKDPNGVEYPGTFGNGLEKCAGTTKLNASDILNLVK